jgi:ATP-dependent RNA helicase SUPV3L1/SUV3
MRPPVLALLGPTNTGKTYLALERMLEHKSGMIGFPLRLLARENYDRISAARGADSVALITGEERIVPKSPRYFVCTVEAMPLDRRVDFLAVDEIQLAADRERGHVFTDRLLHARGRDETMFLGAETIRPLIQKLVPNAAFLSRPRLSTLRYAEPKKLARLPRRTAVIVFSVADLYETAERLRRDTGGAALVFGALSPRTRNAQVGLYQAGEVDFLVATDAIGMGLNLDIDHVVFTGLKKFDGMGPRALRPAEVAQIAGRAGRHTRDGTFGPTTDLGPFHPDLIAAIESHRFDPLHSLFWRNSDLEFGSPQALLRSLERRPPDPVLVRMRQADDHRALEALAADAEIAGRARTREAVELLWEVAQVPDFRNVMTEAHTGLLAHIYRFLTGPEGRLPEDWVQGQVAALDRTEGDTDTLLARIAGIRTWTYLSHRGSWMHDPAHWQQRTRAIEDRLSDALHERLTEQFVDRRAAIIARHDPGELLAEVDPHNEVLIQGLSAGRLEGFRFVPDASARESARGLIAAANRALRADIGDRVGRFTEEPDEAFSLGAGGELYWRGASVARLLPGEDPISPRVEPLSSELLDPPLKERVRRRLAAFVESHLRTHLGPLFALREAKLTGAARGLAFALVESLGTVRRRRVGPQLQALLPADRRALGAFNISFGRETVYLSSLFGPAAIHLRGHLWAIRQGQAAVAIPSAGRPSIPMENVPVPADLWIASGYVPVAGRAIRADRLERGLALAYRNGTRGPFVPSPDLASLLGCRVREVTPLLLTLGFVAEPEGRIGLRRRRA